ncbi:MAG: hypothetical protein AABY15_02720 [Nanoarchaeota archaeon]
MKKYIVITADTTPTDYVVEKTEITDEEIKKIAPVIECLKKRRERLFKFKKKKWTPLKHNWETAVGGNLPSPKEMYVDTGFLTQEQVDLFSKFVPHGDDGIFAIDKIEIIVVQEEQRLF